MQDLNNVFLIGRTTRDAELKEFDNGSAKLELSVAFTTSRKTGDGWADESNFANLTLWGNQAKALARFLTKGKQIAISGHLHQDRWEKDGQKFSMLRIVPDNIQLLGGSEKKNTNNSNETNQAPADAGFPEDMPF